MFYVYLCVSVCVVLLAYRLFARLCVLGLFGVRLRDHYLQIKLHHMMSKMDAAWADARWSPLF